MRIHMISSRPELPQGLKTTAGPACGTAGASAFASSST